MFLKTINCSCAFGAVPAGSGANAGCCRQVRYARSAHFAIENISKEETFVFQTNPNTPYLFVTFFSTVPEAEAEPKAGFQ